MNAVNVTTTSDSSADPAAAVPAAPHAVSNVVDIEWPDRFAPLEGHASLQPVRRWILEVLDPSDMGGATPDSETGRPSAETSSNWLPPGLDVDELGDLVVVDAAVEVVTFPGVVRAGVGSILWVHPGVVVDPTDGAVLHLAPGAHLEQDRPGALERGDVTITDWCWAPISGPSTTVVAGGAA